MPASLAFITDSNRLQPLWQPPPTACLTASGAASVVPSRPIQPFWGGPLAAPAAAASAGSLSAHGDAARGGGGGGLTQWTAAGAGTSPPVPRDARRAPDARARPHLLRHHRPHATGPARAALQPGGVAAEGGLRPPGLRCRDVGGRGVQHPHDVGDGALVQVRGQGVLAAAAVQLNAEGDEGVSAGCRAHAGVGHGRGGGGGRVGRPPARGPTVSKVSEGLRHGALGKPWGLPHPRPLHMGAARGVLHPGIWYAPGIDPAISQVLSACPTAGPKFWGRGAGYLEWGRGGGGVVERGGEGSGTQKFCVSKMAQSDFPDGKFHIFPRWSLWSGGALN